VNHGDQEQTMPEAEDEVADRLLEDAPERSPELMDAILLSTMALAEENGGRAALGNFTAVFVTPDGSLPNFTEQCDGVSIDLHCAGRRLDLSARIELFGRVCKAVHFAHQRALIHGDLRPAYVTVDPRGTVTVSGFPSGGKTRSVNEADLAEVEHKSPEQLSGEQVTTAADIYALGIMLYRLLVGRWPYRLSGGVVAAICEQAAERPSRALVRVNDEKRAADTSYSEEAYTPDRIAADRHTTVRRLRWRLVGDLDAIVLKALNKEPADRYGSADQLAVDLEYFNAGAPVSARSNSLLYQAISSVKRHRLLVAAVTCGVLTSVGVVIALTASLARLRGESANDKDVIAKLRGAANAALETVIHERRLADEGLRPLERNLLESLRPFFETSQTSASKTRLAQIDASIGNPRRAADQYREVVALSKIMEFANPDEQSYKLELARSLQGLGDNLLAADGSLEEAGNAISRARTLVQSLIDAGRESASTYELLGSILKSEASLASKQGEIDDAVQLLERADEIQSQLLANQPESLEFAITLADSLSTLGRLLSRQPAETSRATEAFEQAIEVLKPLVRDRPDLASQSQLLAADFGDLAAVEKITGAPDSAAANLRRALEIQERLERFYPAVTTYRENLAATCNSLSDLQRKRGETTEAIALAQKARVLYEKLAVDHPGNSEFAVGLARTHNIFGRLWKQVGDSKEAIRSWQRAIDQLESLPRRDAANNFDLACNIALCIAATDEKDATPTAQLRRKVSLERALGVLSQAIRQSEFDVDRLQSDSDLNALRSQPEFQRIIKDAEERAASAIHPPPP
jgi:serine/threonine-protein kinase